jgi:hypothetical protein
VLERIEQADSSRVVRCDLKNGMRTEEALLDNVELWLWQAKLGLYGIDLCDQLPGYQRGEIEICSMVIELVEELANRRRGRAHRWMRPAVRRGFRSG